MTNDEGRRSRVPIGTFGGSEPPPPPDDEDTVKPAETPRSRSRFVNTLVGGEARASGNGAPVPRTDPGEPERSPRYDDTLVGIPTGEPRKPRGVPIASVLSPPKWRGAKPYFEGEEPQPQPRVSSIPTPPPVDDALAPESESPSRSRVTTKMGLAPIAQPRTADASEPSEAPPEANTAAIGDAIQELLDGQASVPMQVDEPTGADADLPIEELRDDELVSDPDIGVQPLGTAPPAPPPSAATALHALAGEDDDDDDDDEAAPQPPLKIEEAPAVSEAASAPARGDEAPAPVTAAAPLAAAAPAAVPAPGLEAQPAAAKPAAPKRAPKPAAALPTAKPAPALVAVAGFSEQAKSALTGAALVAAMLAVGVGGWFATRGGYPGPAHRALVAPPPDVTPAPAPPPPATRATTPPSAPQTTQPQAAPPPAEANTRGDDRSRTAKASAHHRGAKSDVADEKGERTTSAESPVLRLSPHSTDGALPDVPSREDVVAALTVIKPAVTTCAHGQHGVAQLDITIASLGNVTYAVVGGDFAGTPEGSCIARVARTAQFVRFAKPRFRVIYPFSL